MCSDDTGACACPDTACSIDGACLAGGTVSADMPCYVCDPARSTTGWSPRASGTVCRTEAGACDLAETCDGVSGSCPADALASASTVCRPSAGGCDVAESCTGYSLTCPEDQVDVACACTIEPQLATGDSLVGGEGSGWRDDQGDSVVVTTVDVTDEDGDGSYDYDLVFAELRAGQGVFSGGLAQETYVLTGAELDPESCGLCLSIQTDYAESGDYAADSKTFLPTGGTATVYRTGEWNDEVQVWLEDVTFAEAEFDAGSQQWQFVQDGCTTELGWFELREFVGPPACAYHKYTWLGPAWAGGDDSYLMSWADLHFYEAENQVDFIQLELYDGWGAMSGGIAPGSYAIGGDDADYDTCGLCLRLFKGYDVGTDELAADGQAFLATAGVVTLHEVGPAGSGTFLAEVGDIEFTPMSGYEGGVCSSVPLTAALWGYEPIQQL